MAVIRQKYLESLSLDVFVLQSLLNQHQCSHGRTKYFQRLSMVVKALRRFEVLEFPDQMEEMQKKVNAAVQEQTRKKQRRLKSRNEDDEWYLSKPATKEDKQLDIIVGLLDDIRQTLTGRIPEIVSRIHHASSSLFVEVSRAFFLPFCTVALGALARIRVLLLRIGFQAVAELQQQRVSIEEILQDRIPSESSSSIEAMQSFLSHQSLEKIMQQYAEQPHKTSYVDSRQGGVEILASLGFKDVGGQNVQRRPCKTAVQRRPGETASPVNTNNQTEPTDPDDTTTDPKTFYTKDGGRIDSDGDDVGEAVGNQITANEDETSRPSLALHTTTTHTQHELDRNMNLVQQHKAKRKREAMERPTEKLKKSSKKKSKETLEGSPSTIDKKAKKESKKKKKKKSSKKDFFDKLFD